MSEILDYEAEPQVRKSIFSLLSLLLGITTWGLGLITFLYIPYKIKVGESPKIPPILPVLFKFIFIAGLITTVLSFVRKEPSGLKKWGGLILNVMMVILGTLALIWAYSRYSQ